MPFPEVQGLGSLAAVWDNSEGPSKLQGFLWDGLKLCYDYITVQLLPLSYAFPCPQVLIPQRPINRLPIFRSVS